MGPTRDTRPPERLADEELAALVDAKNAAAFEVFYDRHGGERVRGAVGALRPEQSEVIALAYFGGFSHSEIAAMLGAPLGTIKGRMRLGLEKLRQALAEGLAVEDGLEGAG